MNEAPISDLFELRHASTDRATIVNVPERRLLAIDGVGDPRAEDYRLASTVLRAASANLATRLRASGYRSGSTSVLETAWWTHPELPADETADAFADRSTWHWQQMVEIPRVATDLDVEAAIDETRRQAGRETPLLRSIHFAEGLSAQILHVGRAPIAEAVKRLFSAVSESGLEPRGHIHELQLVDRGAVPAERDRSILRLPVQRAGS